MGKYKGFDIKIFKKENIVVGKLYKGKKLLKTYKRRTKNEIIVSAKTDINIYLNKKIKHKN